MSAFELKPTTDTTEAPHPNVRHAFSVPSQPKSGSIVVFSIIQRNGDELRTGRTKRVSDIEICMVRSKKLVPYVIARPDPARQFETFRSAKVTRCLTTQRFCNSPLLSN